MTHFDIFDFMNTSFFSIYRNSSCLLALGSVRSLHCVRSSATLVQYSPRVRSLVFGWICLLISFLGNHNVTYLLSLFILLRSICHFHHHLRCFMFLYRCFWILSIALSVLSSYSLHQLVVF